VGDFGLARVKNTTRSVIRSLVGTVNWQAPELWSPKPRYDYKVDVFSCGMVFWEMLAGWTSEKVSRLRILGVGDLKLISTLPLIRSNTLGKVRMSTGFT
jgi:serine/threonine protein kinase